MSMLSYARPEPPRGVVRISGDDRVAFLQGLVSNDVTKVTEQHGIWTALLTPQGKYLHDFMIVADGESLLLEGEAERMEDLCLRLRRFRLRSKIELAVETERFEVVYGWGDGAGAPFGLAAAGDVGRIDGALVLLDPRRAELGVRVIAPAGSAVLASNGFRPADWAEWDRARIRLAVPDGARDLIVDKSILLENGFDELHGVAWDKGCYMGQELTARTKYRGLVKKRLMPIRLSASGAVAGTLVEREDGTEAGELRSSSGDLALALIRLDAPRDALFVERRKIELLA